MVGYPYPAPPTVLEKLIVSFLFLGNGSPQPSTSSTSPTIKEEGQETDPLPGSEGSSSAYIVGETGRQEQGCGAL